MNIIIRNLIIVVAMLCIITTNFQAQAQLPIDDKTISYLTLSTDFVESLQRGEDVTAIVETLAYSTLEELVAELHTDNQRLAFWINIYNGFIIYILNDNPEYYKDRRAFFKTSYIEIAGQKLSFADIEHGILRRSQKELGLGYISEWFPPKYQRLLRPAERYYKIHFGLNCGAKSCPPVASYTSEDVQEQLCTRQTEFLKQETSYNEKEKAVKTTPIMSWFRGDFGGKKGTKKILYKEGLIPNEKVDLRFGDYDWTLDLDNFAN